ncbi:MAG: hypothetical protein IIC22_09170 [Chloroflexi bacterium]|nr:hypothetical protein [Chloroflexota bacterium]
MNAREQSAREQGRIKIFLDPGEVALLLASLALLKSELSIADEQLPSLKIVEARMRIPQGLFSSLDPVIDSISNGLMAQSVADFEERGDVEGSERFHQTIHERWEWHKELIELMQLVLMSAYSGES